MSLKGWQEVCPICGTKKKKEDGIICRKCMKERIKKVQRFKKIKDMTTDDIESIVGKKYQYDMINFLIDLGVEDKKIESLEWCDEILAEIENKVNHFVLFLRGWEKVCPICGTKKKKKDGVVCRKCGKEIIKKVQRFKKIKDMTTDEIKGIVNRKYENDMVNFLIDLGVGDKKIESAEWCEKIYAEATDKEMLKKGYTRVNGTGFVLHYTREITPERRAKLQDAWRRRYRDPTREDTWIIPEVDDTLSPRELAELRTKQMYNAIKEQRAKQLLYDTIKNNKRVREIKDMEFLVQGRLRNYIVKFKYDGSVGVCTYPNMNYVCIEDGTREGKELNKYDIMLSRILSLLNDHKLKEKIHTLKKKRRW